MRELREDLSCTENKVYIASSAVCMPHQLEGVQCSMSMQGVQCSMSMQKVTSGTTQSQQSAASWEEEVHYASYLYACVSSK